ncbi:uncharacterized protein PFLUO_LOCUS4737 [Penicillium psychrofluorescens]|uniref:uncharacterized protein n=1 Tax=Penicillium psychrofluorescens TaxID=3158075 RepID=UPI003CCE2FE3
MSSKLWEYFLQDDVESFQRFLASAIVASQRTVGAGPPPVVSSVKAGSPGSVITSPPNPPKSKKVHESPGTSAPDRLGLQRGNTTLSRTEINARDHYGRTLLHHIASSSKSTAAHFAGALLDIPFVDIYAQDWESGWTALHRALYAGNVSIARALMARDIRDATDFSKPGNQSSGGLIKIKDREGYSPFDVYGATIASRDIKVSSTAKLSSNILGDAMSDVASNHVPSAYGDESENEDFMIRGVVRACPDLAADEVFTFGSNKNLNLGLGDQDDRQFPERISLKRPEHLLQRFYREYQEFVERFGLEETVQHGSSKDLPALIKNKPMKFQNIVMSKLHTAIITNDPESNLFVCGFGPGGRLGTGDESTQFGFVCIETGGLADKRVVSVAFGQDHSLAITEHGEIFSWGSNKFGQLGYSLPRTNNRNDVPMQLTPRQIFNPFKKETILGAAASSIHSVVYTHTGLYTFGKNVGQLGLVDSDARSLEVQTTPRRVGASLFNCPIQMVSAIDRATAVLLQNHEVWVFSQYGYSKLSFPLEVTSRFIRDSFMATRYDTSVNRIVKLAGGGSTICALSSSGDVFTVEVNKSENPSTSTSTTNPVKIRNSLATPVRAWSVKKSHMAAQDVDVGQDGSIIICTTSGSAWRKEKRTKTKGSTSKDYKFARIPGLSRAVAVRSNAFGAYAVAQRECDVTKEQILVDPSTLWDDILPLSPFTTPIPKGVQSIFPDDLLGGPAEPLPAAVAMKQAMLSASDMESQFLSVPSKGTVWVTSSLSDARIPIHEFLLNGRSLVLRKALQEFRQSYYASVPDVFEIEYGKDGQTQIRFQGLDFLTILNLVFFLYTDRIVDFWHQTRESPQNASRYRQVRIEVMRVATYLGLPTLERAARLMVDPESSLKIDMANAIGDPSFFDSGDVVVLLNGGSVLVHSQVVCQRCPFFDAIFHGRSGGRWLELRQADPAGRVHVDLKHVDQPIFDFVLRFLYADMEERLFDEVRTKNLDDFVDLVLDVMFVANELMIDRLSQVCQKMLGRFVTTRNVCYLLSCVAPCYVTEFKDAALEYICLNLEDMLANRYLEGLEDDLLSELNMICHENQLSCFPISRGRNSEEYIFERYPEIVGSIEADKQRRIDAMTLQSRLSRVESYDVRPRMVSNEKANLASSARKAKASAPRDGSGFNRSPMLKPRQSTGDLMFQMDDEAALSPGNSSKAKAPMRGPRPGESMLEPRSYPDSPALVGSIPEAGSLGDGSLLDEQMSPLQDTSLMQSPSREIAMHQKQPLASPPDSSPAPWRSSAISSSKKDLKNIMSETSSRVSNLTLEMADRRESSGKFASKMSQKERKKMQQQQIQEKAAAQQQAKEASQNPWQLPATAAPASLGKLDPLPGQHTPSSLDTDPPKTPQRPAMTLRQTVAGTPPPRSKSDSMPVQTPTRNGSGTFSPSSLSKQSAPGPDPSTPSYGSPAAPSPQPAIQSIRHIPRPDPHSTGSGSRSPSYSSHSLAAILMQQQSEKDEIREAATAKHNLQDIQAEQEFQQWWDQESKRIQGFVDEPDADQERSGKGSAGRSGRGGGGGGGQRKRRGNRNAGSSSAPDGPGDQGNHTTPKKETKGPVPVPQQRGPSGNHTGGLGENSSPRRGGGNQRGKAKGRS